MKIPLKRYWLLLRQYLTPQWRRVLFLAILLFAGIGLRIINPQIIRHFIDSATAGEPLTNLTLAALAFLGFAFAIQVMGVASTYTSENIGWTSTNNLRADLARHALRLDMSFHNQKTPGEMIERIDGDVVDLAIFFGQFVIKLLGNLVLLIGILIVLYLEDWRVGLAMTIYSGVSLYGLSRLRDIAVPHWKAARESSAELFGFLEEHLGGTEDIRSSGATEYSMYNLYKFNRERLAKERKAGRMNVYLVQMWMGLYEAGRVIAFVAGFLLFTQDIVTLGTVYLIVNYTDAIFRPLREITSEIENLQKAGGGIERIEEIYNTTNKIADDGHQALPGGALKVEFDSVSFSYNGEDAVLEDVSFELKPGEVLGLLGRTGSGKTTITRLLFRLYDATEGKICINGLDARDIQLADLQKHIGMVTQDVQLFHATIRDNLTFFDPTISDAQILDALDDLGLMDWYNGLSNGLDTELQSGGKGLSAGEGQLLAFTRVFLRNPGLVILDEASSRLDPATEQRIEHAIDKLLHNRTGIIVAHRLATVERADRILILEKGLVREYGPYAELANNPDSRFSSLLRTGIEEVLV